VTSQSRLILVNALYLKPAWALAFDQGLTEDRPFKVGGSKSKKVPTMMQQNQFGYKKQKDFTAITIPYLGQNLQFLILLPDKNTGIDMLTAKITPQILRDCAALEDRKIVLFLPKFRIEPAALPLSAMLQTLGMKSAFDQPQGSANFSRMAPRQPNDYLAISEIFHKTFISLDEKGTEAAATSDSLVLTALSVGYSEPPKEPLEIHVDHPFLFAIQERESGVCLFLGCVNDPR
jgi:serpin B